MFLYQHARGFNDSELHRRLKGTAYVHIRFELGRAPTQQAINYMWRRRFSLADRQAIEATAREIRAVAADHDIVSDGEPRLDPDEVSDEAVTDEQIMQAIRTARDRGLGAFETDRASNAQYPDDLFFERQAYLNLADVGTHVVIAPGRSHVEEVAFFEHHGDVGSVKFAVGEAATDTQVITCFDEVDGCS
jgi:hypothetical protein